MKDASYYEEDFLDDEDDVSFSKINHNAGRHSFKNPRIKKDNFRKQKQAKQKERQYVEFKDNKFFEDDDDEE